ncbi:hypothetical protein IIA15_01755 [candidate division TA06 bacterium]|nr:hypothetical protein [candidate division TA06 bacterium]
MSLIVISREISHKELGFRMDTHLWEKKLWMIFDWFGVETHQWPTNLMILQEIICEQKPSFIIETGTYKGGSAIFLLPICNF